MKTIVIVFNEKYGEGYFEAYYYSWCFRLFGPQACISIAGFERTEEAAIKSAKKRIYGKIKNIRIAKV